MRVRFNPDVSIMNPSETPVTGDKANNKTGITKPYYDPTLGVELEAWRNAASMAELRDKIESQEGYSVAVLGSGGLLDTIAAVRAGFIPVWGTEVCPKQQALWYNFTSSPNYPDTFRDIPSNAYRPHYLKSGQPCPNYTSEGSAGVEGRSLIRVLWMLSYKVTCHVTLSMLMLSIMIIL